MACIKINDVIKAHTYVIYLFTVKTNVFLFSIHLLVIIQSFNIKGKKVVTMLSKSLRGCPPAFLIVISLKSCLVTKQFQAGQNLILLLKFYLKRYQQKH